MIIFWLFASATIAMLILGTGSLCWAYFMPRNTDGGYRQTGWIITGITLLVCGAALGLITAALHLVRSLPH